MTDLLTLETCPDLRLTGPLATRHRARLIGSGADLLILSHGLGCDQGVWSMIAATLAETHRILLYDLPGAGPLLPDDFDPDQYRTLSAYSDDLLDLLDEIEVERATFIGHSVSGMIGVMAAIEAPDRFEQLILLNASPRYLNDDGYHGGFERADLEALLGAIAANYHAWVAGFAPAAIGVDMPDAIEEFSCGLLAMRPDITLRITRSIFESDTRRLLPLLTVPTLLVHSRNDLAVPSSVAHYLHERIAGSRLAWIDEGGHLPHLSSPAELAAILRDGLVDRAG